MKIYGTDQIVYTPNNIPQILMWVKPNSRVLEFGPGMGYMTRYMKEQLHCHATQEHRERPEAEEHPGEHDVGDDGNSAEIGRASCRERV